MKAGDIYITTRVDNSKLEKEDIPKLKQELKEVSDKAGDGGLGRAFEMAGKKAMGLLGTVGKIAFAITKVISAIAGIGVGLIGGVLGALVLSKAFEEVFEKNKQVKADLDYIRFTIVQALQPAIQWVADKFKEIVQWLAKILYYIGYIIKAWTGYDIFKNAGVDKYEKSLKEAEKSTKKTKKTIKEIKKQLAGFDEMNVLSDNSNSNKNADTKESSPLPSFDFTKMGDMEIPGWLKWIAENKDKILAFLAGLVTYLTLTKLGMSDIKALGFAAFLYLLIDAFKEYDEWYEQVKDDNYEVKDSFEKLGTVVEKFGIAIAVLGITLGNIYVFATGLVIFIYGVYIKITSIFGNLVTDIEETWDGLYTWFDTNLGLFGDLIWGFVDSVLKTFDHFFNGIWGGFSTTVSGILLMLKGEWKRGFETAIKGICNMVIGMLNTLISSFNTITTPWRVLIKGIGDLIGQDWDMPEVKVPTIEYLAKGGIVNLPSKGVPVGSAMAGEKGAEGVIPLTDSQQMALLGEAIGKYITINANITNTMNGRVISRELQKINNENSFAYNR